MNMQQHPGVVVEEDEDPRFVRRARAQQRVLQYGGQMPLEETDIDHAELAQRWAWPAFAWLIGLFNMFVMSVVLKDMFGGKYDWFAHLTATSFAVMSFVALAATYRFLLATIPEKLPTVDNQEIKS